MFSNGQNVQAADLNNFSVESVTTSGDLTVGGTATMNGSAITALNGSNISSGTVAAARLPVTIAPTVVALVDGATVAVNAALATIFTLSAAGNRTILTPTNPVSGQKMVIAHTASGGARTLSLTTGSAGAFRFGTDITALTATGSGLTDYIGAIYNLTADRWDVVSVTKGF